MSHLSFLPNSKGFRGSAGSAFIVRALGEFNRVTPGSQRFSDVPPANPFYSFIDRMAVLQVTLGCTPDHLQYCPSDPVKREQMAAFIIKALGEFNPPTPASQRFLDVPPANVFYNFIDRMAVLNITLGCTPGSHALLSKRSRQPRADGRISCEGVQSVSPGATVDKLRH